MVDGDEGGYVDEESCGELVWGMGGKEKGNVIEEGNVIEVGVRGDEG